MPTLHTKMVPIKARSFGIQGAATSILGITGPASAYVKPMAVRVVECLRHMLTLLTVTLGVRYHVKAFKCLAYLLILLPFCLQVGRLAGLNIPGLVDQCYNHMAR
jgi:hypothetical protein